MTLARAATISGLLIALAVGRPLGAQERAVLELGVSYVRFPQDSVSVAGPSARLAATHTRGGVTLAGSVSGVASSAGASGYLEGSGRWLVPLPFGLQTEVGGELGGLGSTGGPSSNAATSAVVSSRLLRPVRAGGWWVGGAGSLAHREAGGLWGRGVEGGAWWRRAGLQLLATLTREWNVAELFTGPRREGFAGVVPVHYTEGSLGVQAEGRESSLAVSGVARRDPGADHLVEAGFSATATRWWSPTQALLVSVSRQLPDFVHGAEALRSVTVGIRLNEPSPAAALVLRTRAIVQVADVDSAGASDGGPVRRLLRVRAGGATRVEVRGDFTDWEPVELSPAGEVFSAAFVLPPGSHRLVVRLDGGEWLPAANTPAVDDDFGGRVGLLLVQ